MTDDPPTAPRRLPHLVKTMEVKAPDTPFYELIAHPAGEPGEAAMLLWTRDRENAAKHLRWWTDSDAYDVTMYHVTADGRTRLHPRDVAEVAS